MPMMKWHVSIAERDIQKSINYTPELRFECQIRLNRALAQVEDLRKLKTLNDCVITLARGYDVTYERATVETMAFDRCFGTLYNLVESAKADLQLLPDNTKIIDAEKSMHDKYDQQSIMRRDEVTDAGPQGISP